MQTQDGFEKQFKELGITPARDDQSSPEQFARGFEKCTILKNTNVTYSSGSNAAGAGSQVAPSVIPIS